MAAKAKDEREERAELLAHALGDFDAFCRGLCWIVGKDKQRQTLKFNPIQRKYNKARTWRDVVLKPRQIGFSTLELARDVFTFLQPGQRVIVICQTDAGNTYLKKFSSDVERIFEGLERAGLQLDFGERATGRWSLPKRDSFLQIIECGASEAAADKKGRGGTYTRVHSTEAAFYEHPDLTLNALLEGVPSLEGTSVVFESTPNGVDNWFHAKFVNAQSGASAYKAHFFPWFDDPTYRAALTQGENIEPRNAREQELVEKFGITPEQLKWYRQKVIDKGQDLVDQEYASDSVRTFLTSGRLYFELARLDELALMVRDPRESTAEFRRWADPDDREPTLVSFDTAEGLGPDGDWTVATAWGRLSRRHLWTMRAQLRPKPFARLALPHIKALNAPTVVVERNKGLAMIEALEELDCPGVYYDHDGKPGFYTSETSKAVVLEQFASALRDGVLKTPDAVAVAEMRGFVVNPRTGKPYAPGKGKKDRPGDDWIMSAAIGWRVMLEPVSSMQAEAFDPRPAFDDIAGGRFSEDASTGYGF